MNYLEIPSILLPRFSPDFDMQKWPVIACDQFTQDRSYWEKVKIAAAGMPSTLNLIFPEAFLADTDAQKRITEIHLNMERYLKDGILGEPKKGFIYLERDTPFNKKRRGLIAAIDLEQYDWQPASQALIRSTEGTVPDRLPPRMEIRRKAPLELPHILLLIDDDKESLLPQLASLAQRNAPVYSTPLMMNSGSVTGWFLDTESDVSFITEKLDELCRRSVSRYSGQHGTEFLFAVGDGNHSLAAAKGIWNEYKAANGLSNHPCRYALVEIENIYDRAIQFEPIHRIVFDTGFDEIISLLSQLPDFSCRPVESGEELSHLCAQLCAHDETSGANSAGADGRAVKNRFGIICEGRYALAETSAGGIATACLQPLLDRFTGDKPHLVDYIHDEDELFRLADGKTAGILLPPVQKSGLFDTVARLGPLPRKSFSMGRSCEKRFYLECRSLFR